MPPHPAEAPSWKVDLGLSIVVILWGLNFVVLKGVLPRFDPMALAATRFVLVAATLEVLLRWRGRGERLARRDWRPFLVSAVFGYTLYQGAFILGLNRSTAFSTALLINTGPAWAAALLALSGVERVSAGRWGGIGVALLGLAVYVGPSLASGTPAGMGDLLALLAAASWALHGILNKPLLTRYSALHVTTRTFQMGAMLFVPTAIPALLHQDWAGVGATAWAGVGYSVLFPITVAVTLWNWAIGQRGVGRTFVYQHLVPVTSGILSWLFLGEAFGLRKVAGGALVLLGVALTRRAS